jgi:hypothetical protein
VYAVLLIVFGALTLIVSMAGAVTIIYRKKQNNYETMTTDD